MASDLYKDVLTKDKENLSKSNPRTRSFGSLTSSDHDYKNFLAGMRPRTKSNTGTNENIKHSSFVDSAARVQQTSIQNQSNAMQSRSTLSSRSKSKTDSSLDGDNTKESKSKVSTYSALSGVPSKKTFDTSPQIEQHQNDSQNSHEVDFTNLKQAQSDSTGSVGRLRSMFDKSPDIENKPVQLRANRSRRERPNSTSFSNDYESRPKTKVSGIYDRHSLHFSPLQVESLLGSGNKEEEEVNDIKNESIRDEQYDTTNAKHKIDVNSLLAPEESKEDEKQTEEESDTISPREEQVKLEKQMEIDRMRRTQEEIQIEQKFNIKRRSLKERLNDLAVGNEVVPTYVSSNEVENTEVVKIDTSIKTKVAPPVPAKPDTKHLDHLNNKSLDISNNQNATVAIERNNETDTKINEEDHTDRAEEEKFNNDMVEINQKVNSTASDLSLQNDSHDDLTTLESIPSIALTRQDSDEKKSEIDKYKSAVERFDDFLNKQDNLFAIDDQDPLKDFPNDFTPADSSKLFSDDLTSTKQLECDSKKEEIHVKDNKTTESDDLMNSILKHMEQSKRGSENNEFVSLFPSSSREEDPEATKKSLQSEIEKPMPLMSPEAPPRLSKLQGRTPPLPTFPPPPMSPPPSSSPPSTVVEETLTVLEQQPVESTKPERPSSLSISTEKPSVPVIEDYSSESDENDSTGYHSLENAYNVNQAENISQMSEESGFYSSYTHNGYYDDQRENIIFPPPPAKSNLMKRKQEKRRKVGFKDGNIEEVMFTYGPNEYDRANVDIDPMASSAEWELEKRVDNMDIFSVDLQKDERGLGLSIIGLGVGTDSGFEKLGIFVKTLTENGASQKDGRIQVNDQILEVNGVSLVGVTQFFAAQTLKGTSGVVRFLMGREKSRHTQFSPGAPILDNPDMKKHIEEMNKTVAQLEEYEIRALEAERTLEEVKIELLKAEERAHEAEHNLQETKDMLKAATEGGKKNTEKFDDLHRSLKEVTNELSASKENLLQLHTLYEGKDKELVEFQQRLDDKQEEERKLAESNEQMNTDLQQKIEELEGLKNSNDKLKDLLQELTESRGKEIAVFQEKEVELEKKLLYESEQHQKYLEDIDKSHKVLKQENKDLKQKLEDTDRILDEFLSLENKVKKFEQLEAQFHASKKSNTEKSEEIGKLKEKVNYLQELLTKDEKGSSAHSSQIEEDYIAENTELKAKIKELEEQLEQQPKVISSEREIQAESVGEVFSSLDFEHPDVPRRENVHSPPNHIFGIRPPLVNRNSKPLSPPLSPTKVRQDFNEETVNIEIETSKLETSVLDISTDTGAPEISTDTGVPDISTNTGAPDLLTDTSPEISDTPSEINEPNPIPKPPRGHFVSPDDKQLESPSDEFVILEKPADVRVVPELSLPLEFNHPLLTSEGALSNEPLKVTTPTAGIVNLDDLPEDKVDNDSIEGEDEDQGQFQIIEENVDEEKVSLNNFGESSRRHTSPDTSKVYGKLVNQEFFDSSFSGETWAETEWERLDKDKQADLIAEQIVSQSPIKRKISNASSSSDEENSKKPIVNQNEDGEVGRTQSIKIDSSYFQQSKNKEDSFDQSEVSILDVDEQKTNTPKRSFSFDSVIPETPVLDTRMAHDKISVKTKRKPPTREGRLQMLDSNDNLNDDTSQAKPSSLPRNVHNNIALHSSLSAAKSVPNLSTNPDTHQVEKSEKHHKHKFGFHIPKVFKKSKLAKKSSHDKTDSISPVAIPKSNSVSAIERPMSAYVSPVSREFVTPVVDVPPPQSTVEAEVEVKNESPTTPIDVDVVPISDKTESMSQEHENEAGTEEAVVPFHQKEQSMLDEVTDDVEHQLPLSEDSSPTMSPSHVSNISQASPDDVTLELSAPSSSANSSVIETAESSKTLTLEKDVNEDMSETSSFNERGIDVGTIENGHTEEANITHWTRRPPSVWDVRQVGLWLVEMNLNQYVNSFKSHNVDGQALLRADGNRLKEYGVHNQEHRAEIKKRTKEFRNKLGKDSFNKGKNKDHKTAKDKLQFWKGKYKPH